MSEPPPRRYAPPGRPDPRAELVVLALLGLAAVAAVGFVVAYVDGADNQLLGATLGVSLVLLAVAFIVAAERLVAHEEAAMEVPDHGHYQDRADVEEIVRDGGEGLTRRRLLGAGAAVAGTALGAALIVPLASLGPNVGDTLEQSPWRRGVRFVDEHGHPIAADAIETKSFITAFPEGADPRQLASPVVVVRVDPTQLRLPRGRQDWAPGGLLAFSKICTHAGCAISLYRAPLYAPTSPGPALVCPCHYSTFDVLRGALPVFGPAVRSLPELPVAVVNGDLVAAGGYSGPVGPSWWGVRRT
jgi:ubiquinol-cytochrome c reductase iron-sulfur subunit